MSRTLNSGLTTNISQDQFNPFFAIDLLFDSPNELYLWTGSYGTTINSKSYIAAGNLLSFSAVDETTEVSARSATATLSGVSSSILSLALATPYQGRRCNIYMGTLDDTSDYTEIFAGFMDTMDITEGPEDATIVLTLENKLVDLERPRVFKYSSENQKFRYPGDLGLDFVESMQDQNLAWGKET
tara:strand:+ start:738 stop:1292 length:555 start_codon:yes stop_codon:yes gene_type:complete